MPFLTGPAEAHAIGFLLRAAEAAKRATCLRAKCGTVIAQGDQVIGEGWNSPPGDLASQRRCQLKKSEYDLKVTDKTCCVHAEERAIMDALRRYPDRIPGSTLYFIRLDERGEPARAGKPYCTICSKMALDAGIALFVLWHADGVCAYPAAEYNALSYRHGTSCTYHNA